MNNPNDLVGLVTETDCCCICCGHNEWSRHFQVLRKCSNCGFIRADLNLNMEEIRQLYAEDYFHGKEYGDYVGEADSHRKNFAYRFKLMKRLAPDLRSLFEVGCAYGFWLEWCSKNGMACAGVDICAEAVAYATKTLGQQAVAADFLQLDFSAREYEAFCMWDTIEHLDHPESFLTHIYEALPPNGWLFVTTGDIGSLVAQLRGSRWRMIHPPTHLQYFSRATIRRLLNSQGFDVVQERSLSVCRTVGGMLGRMHSLGRGRVGKLAGLLNTRIPMWARQLGVWLDLGDIMFIAARKIA